MPITKLFVSIFIPLVILFFPYYCILLSSYCITLVLIVLLFYCCKTQSLLLHTHTHMCIPYPLHSERHELICAFVLRVIYIIVVIAARHSDSVAGSV